MDFGRGGGPGAEGPWAEGPCQVGRRDLGRKDPGRLDVNRLEAPKGRTILGADGLGANGRGASSRGPERPQLRVGPQGLARGLNLGRIDFSGPGGGWTRGRRTWGGWTCFVSRPGADGLGADQWPRRFVSGPRKAPARPPRPARRTRAAAAGPSSAAPKANGFRVRGVKHARRQLIEAPWLLHRRKAELERRRYSQLGPQGRLGPRRAAGDRRAASRIRSAGKHTYQTSRIRRC
jgi:hypothetical protein